MVAGGLGQSMLTNQVVICLQNFSIVESPDPFGAGAYNFQSISAVRRNRVWLRKTTTWLTKNCFVNFTRELLEGTNKEMVYFRR